MMIFVWLIVALLAVVSWGCFIMDDE